MLLGMSGVTGFFLAWLLHVTTAQLGPAALSLVVAALVIMLVRELILPDALRGMAAAASARPPRAMEPAQLGCAEPAQFLRACIDTAPAAPGAGVGELRQAWIGRALLDAELLVERCAALLRWGPTPPREPLRAALAAVVGHHHGDPAALTGKLPQPSAPRPAPGQRAVRSKAGPVAHPHTRQAVQATIACAAAIVAGQWLSLSRWYWALLAAFIVFAGTASTGETLQKIWTGVFGTVLGVAAAVALVSVVGFDRNADMALIVVLALVWLYLQPVSCLAMMFCIPMVLGLVYGLVGRSIDQLLTLRLEETAIGAFFDGVVAMTLFPVPARDVMTLKIGSYLEALDASVAASIDALLGAPSSTTPREGAHRLDGELHELLARSQPMLHQLPFLAPPQTLADAIAVITAKAEPPAAGVVGAAPRGSGLDDLEQIARILASLAREPR